MLKKLAVLILAALQLLVQPAPVAAAAGSGTLFAVFGETHVVKLDPATGSMTTLADLTDPTLQFGNTLLDLVSDAANHRLYTEQVRFNFDPTQFPPIVETYQLVTIDTRTGVFTVSPDMPQRVGLAFDPSTGELFGLNLNCCPFQVFKVDTTSGGETLLATIDGSSRLSSMAVAPGQHTIYIAQATPGVFPPTGFLLSIDTVTGAITVGPALARGVVNLAFDSSTGMLYGKTFSIPAAQVVSISPSTGAETTIGSFNLGFGGNSLTVDLSTHTIYLMEDILEAFGFFQEVGAVDPTAGTISLSPKIPLTGYIRSLAFEGVVASPAKLRADVLAAIASGAIDNAGVGNALVSQLNAAEAARARGQCASAASIYGSFVNLLNAQSGVHVAAATASQLVGEAQIVMANCP